MARLSLCPRSVPCLVLAWVLLLWSSAPAAAQFTTKPTVIVGRNSGKCVNVAGASTANEADIVQWECREDLNGMFRLEPAGDAFHIVAAHSNKCLNVLRALTDNGTRVVQYPCSATSTNDDWSIEAVSGYYRLRAKHSNKCLNVFEDRKERGVKLIQWECNGSKNEQFSFGDGFVPAGQPLHLVSGGLRLCADVLDAGTAPGTKVVRYPCKPASTQTANQDFYFLRVQDGYILMAGHANLGCLSAGGSVFANAPIVLESCQTNSRHIWQVSKQGDAFRLTSKLSGLCLDTQSAGSGAALIQRACDGAENQRWTLTATERVGSWGPIVDLNLVPVTAAALKNGKVLMFSSYDPLAFNEDHGETLYSVYDPNTNTSTTNLPAGTGHEMFCPGTAILPDGRLLVNGGLSTRKTSLYNPSTNRWSPDREMVIGRGYNASTTLSTGDVFTIGGSWSGEKGVDKAAELWQAGNGWRTVANAPASKLVPQPQDPEDIVEGYPYRGDNHAWLFGWAAGVVFHAGPSKDMKWFGSASGNLSAGARADDAYSMNGNAVMYEQGKILKLGGAPAYKGVDASRSAYVIDINAGVVPTKTGSLNTARAFHNSVVLPDGRVLVVGGQSWPEPFDDRDNVLSAEIWTPASTPQTSSFRVLSNMNVPRTYHSVALLLPDARVLVAGGGLCGNGCNDNNHPNLQIYSPGYLFAPSGELASRPAIVSRPLVLSYNATFGIATDRPVTSVSLIRMSSVTHSVNNDQRRLSLSVISRSGNGVVLRSPANSGVATPGPYMMFAMDAAGVPSMGAIVELR